MSEGKASDVSTVPQAGEGQAESGGLLHHLEQLWATFKRGIEDDVLETAISRLQGVVTGHADTETRIAAKCCLIKALLARFALHGWVEDLDKCEGIMMIKNEFELSLKCLKQMHDGDGQWEEQVMLSAQQIEAYRKSIDVATLMKNIAQSGLAPQPSVTGQVYIVLGRCLVLKYMAEEKLGDLDEAAALFVTAKSSIHPKDPLFFVVATLLRHLSWIKFVDCLRMDGLMDMERFEGEAGEQDREGQELVRMGMLKIRRSDELEEAISLLSSSLTHRPVSHPKRAQSLFHLSTAFFARYNRDHNYEDLDEGIQLTREVLALRPLPHPVRLDPLQNLASSLYLRFEKASEVGDLDEAIAIRQESLALPFETETDRQQAISTLASSLMARYELKQDLQDVEECIRLRQIMLASIPGEGPGRPRLLAQIASSIHARFRRTGCICLKYKKVESPEDLDESISFHREVVDSALPNSETFEPLSNFIIALQARFNSKGDIQDIDEAVSTGRKLLSLHSGRPEAIEFLALSLSTRFKHSGEAQDLDECISCYRESIALRHDTHPIRFATSLELANLLETRFERQKNSQDLDDRIVFLRNAVALRPLPSLERFQALRDLAGTFLERFQANFDPQDLEESISNLKSALSIEMVPQPSRSLALVNLGGCFFNRYKPNSSIEDLLESITLCRDSINLSASPFPKTLERLANSLSALSKVSQNHQALVECIELRRQALSITRQNPSYDRSSLIQGLAEALRRRSDSEWSIQDLNERISLWKEALTSAGGDGVHLPWLNNLAAALSERFESKGDFEDLEECIKLHRKVLDLQSAEDPSRHIYLGNLAQALAYRFERKDRFEDLQECISLVREVIELAPASERQSAHNNLAIALHNRFKIKSDPQDMDECIQYLSRALELTAENTSVRISALNSLASCYATRYDSANSPRDLNKCISLLQEALDLHAAGYPSDRPGLLNKNMAASLQKRFKRSGDVADLERAIGLLRDAVDSKTGSLMMRLNSAGAWAEAAQEVGHSTALEAYQRAIGFLPLLASVESTLQQRQNVLFITNLKNLAGDSVRCAIEANELETAVVLHSTARSTFWSQTLQLRKPLDQLYAVNPLLADELRAVSENLEKGTQGSEKPSNSVVHDVLHLRTLSERRVALLGKIREMDGFRDFLLPPTFDSLKDTARNGPVVFLNAGKFGCDAVIMRPGGTLERVRLPNVGYKILNGWKTALQNLAQMIPLQQGTGEALEGSLHLRGEGSRKPTRVNPASSVTPNDRYRQILEGLWKQVVKPIIDVLQLSKTDTPKRIWWCPGGHFTFFPIHAAGLYSTKPSEEDECLSDFAISSYCYSPQNLLLDRPQVPTNFKMLAVLEPEGTDVTVKGLPMTEVELEKIQERIPSADDLIVRVGSKTSPNTPEVILNDIRRSTFVHFGCHGMQHESNPLESSLLLSGGRLTMSKIISETQQSSGASLAYLSACETALGDEERPDESLSLAATMVFAGFRGVVGTLWSIKDDDAPIVADAFYRHLFRKGRECPPDPVDAAEGLHLAVKELRSLGREFHRWVPFAHFGI
ncbi:TPR-like protein [Coprinopsis marcescibilis]|uniref:TPR-like protein n=1 Tax=Coprinopsis marcescibilis TaxID=230819 RepID=A0A5C3KCW0_COPMA|nr:TPR-like protein [Coprinopsis marcescibilis]